MSVTAYNAQTGLKQLRSKRLDVGVSQLSFLPNEVLVECELKLERAFSGNIHERMTSLLAKAQGKSTP